VSNNDNRPGGQIITLDGKGRLPPEEIAAQQLEREMFQKNVLQVVGPALASLQGRVEQLRQYVVLLDFNAETMQREIAILRRHVHDDQAEVVAEEMDALNTERAARLRILQLPMKPLLIRPDGTPELDNLLRPVVGVAVDEGEARSVAHVVVRKPHPLDRLDGESFTVEGKKKGGDAIRKASTALEKAWAEFTGTGEEEEADGDAREDVPS